ncbi:hypothetical protein PLESTB_001065700 [Pleodorina starrii]|uniref:Uncharacterized protein n=1 Tax=Pleodorina starrii TaxID=330485 RepID=A0A9W6F4E3_9CHLO|nr:hypothetical protein PLESTB_001065700 [Pleodorina starrii]GLC64099.1 hypothetical protein PLESTF_000117900 [Pleodorina starrii]
MLDRFLAASQASFAIPSISRGHFFIAISFPEFSSLSCRACGCSVHYTALSRGVSSLYTSTDASQPAAQQDGSSSSRTSRLPSLDDILTAAPGRGGALRVRIVYDTRLLEPGSVRD